MRTDLELKVHVMQELDADPDIDADRIDVRVACGRVGLTGCVTSRAEMDAAIRAVWRVGGIEAVVNALRIEKPAVVASPRDDH